MTSTTLVGEPTAARHDSGHSQSYSNHRRYFPLYHYVAAPILFGNVIVRAVALARGPGAGPAWDLVVAIGLVALLIALRASVIIVQNRLIRLETRARLALLLDPELRGAIGQLRTHQLIGLRFASDGELPSLVRRCLAGELRTTDQIKRAVREWQPDWLRA
ncbi:MAG: hypothetical protein NVS4B3_12230 [Gemmatimonadaceae bacterium]